MKLIVKNFGPIKDVEIESKQLTVFIGPQASGKSVLAKLLTIFNDEGFRGKTDYWKYFLMYNIPFIETETFIEFYDEKFHFKYKNENTDVNGESRKLNTTLYIPTERIFVASISDFLYNFIQSKINLPESSVRFGANFENARRIKSNYKIPFLDNIEYSYDNNSNYLKIDSNEIINFSLASSGMQSVIPMALVIEYYSENDSTNFVVEEPELNLYPKTQKKVVEFITEKCLSNTHNLIVTTHSPYILTSFSNLIQAKNTAVESIEAAEKVKKIIPEKYWINFENVAAYYIDNGTAKNILDYENKTIDANAIEYTIE